MSLDAETRTYSEKDSAVFLKTSERNGALSNMAPGFGLCISGVDIRSSEALYQASRFPHMPWVQEEIFAQASPMTAKMKSKKYISNTRNDWIEVRVRIMKFCLRAKLVQNFEHFSEALINTGNIPIVEKKIRREDFWGAKVQSDGTLRGKNVLGRLLMELRDQVKTGVWRQSSVIEPPNVCDFLILGKPVSSVTSSQKMMERFI